MSAGSNQRSEDQFLCSICLNVFTDPVTTPCGHNFCKRCITKHWNDTLLYKCPLCNDTFFTRPQLKINTFIREMVDQFRHEAQQEASSSSEQQAAKPGEVPCDVCTGTKLKALKSCLVCLASYCHTHLQPHLTSSRLRRHQLRDPVENLEDRMCRKHDKPLELFCKTDHTCVCMLCSVLDHKTHEFVPLREEYEEKKTELEKIDAEVQLMIHKRHVKIHELKEMMKISRDAADRETAEGVQVFTALMESVQRGLEELREEIQYKQKAAEKQAEDFIKDLEQEISELRKRSSEVKQLSRSEDHLHLLQSFSSLKAAPPTKDWTEVRVRPSSYDGTVVRAVSQLQETLRKQMKMMVEERKTKLKHYETASKRLADDVRGKSTKLKGPTGSPEVYVVPLKVEHISTKGWKCFSFGEKSTKPNRTIMVLGATGAGKSTLINGMINHILGVQWEDPYRFVLVQEDQSESQAHSQTSEVTVYRIHHQQGSQIDYTLTIVDTPGFGDTRGIERDKLITEQIHNLFTDQNGVAEIDAVCFVAQASLARPTPAQRYVFDSILSIFGKDVAENIRILVTFADMQQPPVLAAINESGVPCPKDEAGRPVHFKFNNAALFADSKSSAAGSESEDDSEGNFDHMFWKMGADSMKRFFAALNQMKTKSLMMTQEVIRERKELEVSVEGLQKQVKLSLPKMEEIRETSKILRDNEAEISRNEKFEVKVTVMKPFQVDISGTGNYITNCQRCHTTCHYPCGRRNDKDKAGCWAMTNGKCRVCPGKCDWTVHFNQKYKWEYRDVTEIRTVEELKEKYDKARGERMTVQELMNKLQAAYKQVENEVISLVQKPSKCLNRLKEIALKPNPLSTPEYIDLLIEGEKSEAKPGWKERTESLMKMKERAECMARIERGERLLDVQDSGPKRYKSTSRCYRILPP